MFGFRKGSPTKSAPSSADNTLNRPRMDQSGPTVAGYNENTLPYINREANRQPQGYMDGDMQTFGNPRTGVLKFHREMNQGCCKRTVHIYFDGIDLCTCNYRSSCKFQNLSSILKQFLKDPS